MLYVDFHDMIQMLNNFFLLITSPISAPKRIVVGKFGRYGGYPHFFLQQKTNIGRVGKIGFEV